MSFESVIEFFIQHNMALTEGLIAGVLIISIYLGFRSLKAPPELGGASSSNLSEIEETLKKLLEKAALVPSAGSPGATGTSIAHAEGGATPGVSPELLGEIESLKKKLLERQAEIEALKTQNVGGAAAAGGSRMSDEERAKLEAQLKELQSKLSEYEIISEDIADLSFYKEENAKLLKQLEGKPVAPVSQVVDTPAVAKPKTEPEIVGKAKASSPEVAAPVAPPAPVAAAAAPAEVIPTGVDEDLMAEFEVAVGEQGGVIPEPEIPAPVEAAPAAPEAEAQNLGSLDMDKMMNEAQSIPDSVPSTEAVNSLETSLDENKLLAEASELGEIKADDKNLMEEFENFVKKGT